VDNKAHYTCARICVEVDLESGLPEEVNLTVGSSHHYQNLDYEQLSLKCRNCHEHGHFQRNYPKIQPTTKEDVERWKKVQKGKVAKPKEKKSQDPGKQNHPSSEVKEGLAKTAEVAESQEHDLEATVTLEPLPEPPNTKEPLKSQDEHISLSTKSRGDSDGKYLEKSSSHGTPKRPSRGRKPEKKKREDQSYREVVQGSQHTIPEMISTRTTRKQGRAPKGATTPQNVK
jgi:hypothetical protein